MVGKAVFEELKCFRAGFPAIMGANLQLFLRIYKCKFFLKIFCLSDLFSAPLRFVPFIWFYLSEGRKRIFSFYVNGEQGVFSVSNGQSVADLYFQRF